MRISLTRTRLFWAYAFVLDVDTFFIAGVSLVLRKYEMNMGNLPSGESSQLFVPS